MRCAKTKDNSFPESHHVWMPSAATRTMLRRCGQKMSLRSGLILLNSPLIPATLNHSQTQEKSLPRNMLSTLLALASAIFAPALAAPVETLDNPYNQLIYSARDNLCLSLIGGDKGFVYNGAPIVSWPCDTASRWVIHRGEGKIELAQTPTYVIDIGLEPGNNQLLKIWEPIDGAPQQRWATSPPHSNPTSRRD